MHDENQTKEPQVPEADEFPETTPCPSEPPIEHLAEPAPDAEIIDAESASSVALAAGPRPLFQLPFLCGQEWVAFTRADHSPNPNSLDRSQASRCRLARL